MDVLNVLPAGNDRDKARVGSEIRLAAARIGLRSEKPRLKLALGLGGWWRIWAWTSRPSERALSLSDG